MGLRAHYILKAIEGIPDEFQVFPFGTVEIEGEEPAFLDDESMDSIVAEFERRGNDKVVDYEHQTITGKEAPAAGWIKKFVRRGTEGLWAVVEWTERAREYFKNKEYRYFSPVFWTRNSDRKILFVDNIALTNDPKMNHLRPIVASMRIDERRQQSIKEEEEKAMLKKLAKLFGLADDAGEDKVVETATAIVAKNADLEKQVAAKPPEIKEVVAKEVLTELGLEETATQEVVIAKIKGLKASHTATGDLSQQVAKLSADIAAIKQEDLIGQAVLDGKITEDQLEKWGKDMALNDPEQFKKVVLAKARGSEVPVDKLPKKDIKGDGTALDDVQLSINKMMGVSDETWKKYGPKEATA